MIPEPYYDQDGITIYNSDCRQVLPYLPKVDLVLTDPPYGIGEAAGANKSRGKLGVAKDYGDDAWDNDRADIGVITAARHVSDSQVIFGGNYYADALPPSSCWLVWDKDNGENDFADCELAWTSWKKAVRMLTYRWNGMLQEPGVPKETRYHPTQKPTRVMTWCISLAPKSDTILDPFMGSGATLVAAKLMGKKCIGIEREEKYCRIAVERLAQGVLL